jgi:hypothetical protein
MAAEPLRRLSPLAYFAFIATAHTWPLASDPARLSRNDNGDTQLNEWIVSWIAHQLPRDPLRLFDANIFHPEPRSLAFSEPLLVPGLLGAPLRWAGASPVLTYNLLLLVGFVGAGLAGYRLVHAWTGDALAGILAGTLLAFNAQTLSRLPHLQAHYAWGLPLALLALDRILAEPRARGALWLGVLVATLAMTSGYWAALASAALLAGFLARTGEWWPRTAAVLPRLALAALVALVLALPVLLPYWRVHREQGLSRNPEESAAFASTPASYLATPARLHHAAWSHRFYGRPGGSAFPGVVAAAMAALAIPGLRSSGRVRMLVVIGLVGFLLSLGPATPLYAGFGALFPPMRVLRDPSRFAYLVLVAIAPLAGFGLAALRRLRAGGAGVALALIGLANLEALAAPVSYVPFDGISPVYRHVAEHDGPTVLAEMPFYRAPEVHRSASYVLASTAHWKPLLNGYSGFTPPSYVRRAEILRHFPDEEAIAELRRSRVTHVMVHAERYAPTRATAVSERLAAMPDFVLLEVGPSGERLYALR